jgi:hypothetical protein
MRSARTVSIVIRMTLGGSAAAARYGKKAKRQKIQTGRIKEKGA